MRRFRPPNRRVATVLKVLRVGLLVYVGFCLMLLAFQRRLIYYPTRAPEDALLRQARGTSLSPWRDEAGRLHGWRAATAARPPGRPTAPGLPAGRRRMVLFHGNAGYALHRTYFADLLRVSGGGADWDLYLFEYPGYGARPGTPAESDIVRLAVEAVDGLWEQDPEPVFLTGESLGAAVACAVAKQRPDRVAGLLLITPFNNLSDVARHHYPFLPVRWLLRERYPSDAHLRGYAGPVAFVLADEDEVVPAALGRKLFEGYSGPKRLWVLPGVGHNDIAYDAAGAHWWREGLGFLLSQGRQASSD